MCHRHSQACLFVVRLKRWHDVVVFKHFIRFEFHSRQVGLLCMNIRCNKVIKTCSNTLIYIYIKVTVFVYIHKCICVVYKAHILVLIGNIAALLP